MIWIVYDRVRYAVNTFFASSLLSSFKKLGVDARLVFIEDISADAIKNEPMLIAAVMRTVSLEISDLLKTNGVRVFNNQKVSEVCNDKYKTYQLALSLNIPVLKTEILPNLAVSACYFEFPFVIKSRDGHGGKEVFLIKDKAQLDLAYKTIDVDNYVIQKLASDVGQDIRLYFLGNKLLKAIKRTSKSDFRSNFTLGGSAEVITPNSEILGYAKKMAEHLESDFIGIDFFPHNGGFVLNEVEDVVGCRMLYSLTDIDAAEVYAKHILSKTKRFPKLT